MRAHARLFASLVFAGLGLVAPRPSGAIILPNSFVDETLPFTFTVPTDLTFLPDGRMLVTEKRGVLWLITGTTRKAVWHGESEILDNRDVGLLSVTVHPDLENRPWLYLLYTCDPNSGTAAADTDTIGWGRLTRYRFATPALDSIDLSSRTVLLGNDWTDGWPTSAGVHHVDDLEWGRDGSLFVSSGEGAHFIGVDAGGRSPRLFEPGRLTLDQDVGAFRSQMLTSLSGKVLRIDPETGLGLDSNPFYDGDPNSIRSRVWTYGHRNPFRLTLKPLTGSIDPSVGDPGTLYITDVGWNEYEELDVSQHGGQNYGWPCFEGLHFDTLYQNTSPAHHGCGSFGTLLNPQTPSAPILDYHHGEFTQSTPPGYVGYAVTGGSFYDAFNYPKVYQGGYFYGDAVQGWVRVAITDDEDEIVQSLPFAEFADGPVSFATDPIAGDVHFVGVWTGRLHRIRYIGTAAVRRPRSKDAPVLSTAYPNPTTGLVNFTLTLPKPALVKLQVLDASGRVVWEGRRRERGAGANVIRWRGKQKSGLAASPGIYFAHVNANGVNLMTRFALVR